ERIRRIRDERAKLQRQLDQTERPDLDTGRTTLHMLLDLLTAPEALYRLASKRARRVLNQALFTRLYLNADESGPEVPGDEPTEPSKPLLDAQRLGYGTEVNLDDRYSNLRRTWPGARGRSPRHRGSGGRPPGKHSGPWRRRATLAEHQRPARGGGGNRTRVLRQ